MADVARGRTAGLGGAFRWFLAGRAVSLLGSSMAPVALAFAVLDASGNPSDLGVVLAGRMLPLLGFLLVGGVAADRFSRRAVLVVSSTGAGLTQGAVAVVLLTGHYGLLLVTVLEVTNGTLDAFTTPALRGVVPELVAPAALQRASSVLASTRNATKILGPSAAGILVVTVGSGAAIALDALSFVVAAALLARLDLPRPARGAPSTLRRDLLEGWSAFRGTRWVVVVVAASTVMNLVQTGTWQILGPALTEQRSGAATWGFVLTARGVGLLVASLLTARLVVRHLLRWGQLAVALVGLPLVALGLQLGAAWLVASALVAGMASAVGAIAWETSIQEHVPRRVLSRVASLDDLFSYAAIPLGQLAVGPLAGALGAPAVVLVAAVVFLAAATAPLLSRSVRDLPHRTGTGSSATG